MTLTAVICWYYWSKLESSITIEIIAVTMSGFAMTMTVWAIVLAIRSARTLVIREHNEFAALRMRLEDVVRLTSQIEDHGAVDSIHRIALRLALAEAEGALKVSRY